MSTKPLTDEAFVTGAVTGASVRKTNGLKLPLVLSAIALLRYKARKSTNPNAVMVLKPRLPWIIAVANLKPTNWSRKNGPEAI